MNGLLILYTAGFIAYGLMELLGLMPQEMKSAGLTLPGIFDRLYGDPVCLMQYAYYCFGYNSYLPFMFEIEFEFCHVSSKTKYNNSTGPLIPSNFLLLWIIYD